jgi:hypothetical protein
MRTFGILIVTLFSTCVMLIGAKPGTAGLPSSSQLQVQAGPNPTFPPQWVKISVNQDEFFALCTFKINYGDGSQILKLTTPLPIQFGHTYNRPGIYTISAKAVSGCVGVASTKLVVKYPIYAPGKVHP